MTEAHAPSTLAWRTAREDDLDAVMAIQGEVHTMLPEQIEVFAAKLHLCPEGCRMLMAGSEAVGYGFAHPVDARLDPAARHHYRGAASSNRTACSCTT